MASEMRTRDGEEREIESAIAGMSRAASSESNEGGTIVEMSGPETFIRSDLPIRPLRRVEYELLATQGYFKDERVELLLGYVVPMSPIGLVHAQSTHVLQELLRAQIGKRASVRIQLPFAASDVSEPEPDVFVVPDRDYWDAHPARAFLTAEVACSSLRKDRGPKAAIYGLADVDEYWIVNHDEQVIDVYRDRHDGEWRTRTTHGRGETIAMAAFPDVTIAVSDVFPPVK